MTKEVTRKFEDQEARRGFTPLLLGLMGPSGGGKTYSALLLAEGIQKVSGGDIYLIDTEARRSLNYADQFKFRFVQFDKPFGSLDYLAAIEYCVKKGAGVVIVDSMSHEHEGPGGVLEQHDDEVLRLSQAWKLPPDAVNFPAWSKPKAERRRLINTIIQLNLGATIFTFRAKNKTKIAKDDRGKSTMVHLGFMPIAGQEFIYEMTASCLLMPNAGGVPTWDSDEPGEKMMIKLPDQFKPIFAKTGPITRDHGEKMARWAKGEDLNKAKTKAPESEKIHVEQYSDDKKKLLKEISDFLIAKWPGTGADATTQKAAALSMFFGHDKWSIVQHMEIEKLQIGLNAMKEGLSLNNEAFLFGGEKNA